jgi:hypothetical protein
MRTQRVNGNGALVLPSIVTPRARKAAPRSLVRSCRSNTTLSTLPLHFLGGVRLLPRLIGFLRLSTTVGLQTFALESRSFGSETCSKLHEPKLPLRVRRAVSVPDRAQTCEVRL